MTVFVSVGDPIAELSSLLNQAPGKDRSPSSTVAQLLTPECIDDLLAGDASRARSALTIAFSMITSMNVQDIAKLSDRVTSSASKSNDAAELRLWAMVSLFNAVQVGSIKGRVLTALLQYGLNASLAASLRPALGCVDQWLKDWSLDDVTSKARILSLVADLYDACDAPEDAQKQRLSILSIAVDDKSLRQLQADVACKSIAYVFRYGKITSLDMLMATITSRQVPSSPLIDLLGLICSESSTADLDAFCAKHDAVLAHSELDTDRLRTYLQILNLCSLASGQKVLKLETIQKSLQLTSIDDAEQAVIDAVSLGLMDAQIDEQDACVYITSCMYRSLNDAVWKDLQQRLQIWRDSVGAVLPWSQHVQN